jgi:hypothetical protein
VAPPSFLPQAYSACKRTPDAAKPVLADRIGLLGELLGTGIAVAITGIVLLGIGGVLGADWERREIEKYQRRRGNEPGG